MPRAARDIPPPLELLCLKALWTIQEGNVRDVQRIVGQARPLAYTTIMTVLDRLVRKGKLGRRKAGRAFVYTPQESRDALRHIAVQELLTDFFDGSESELMLFLRGSDGAGALPGLPTPPVVEPVIQPVAAPMAEAGIDTILL